MKNKIVLLLFFIAGLNAFGQVNIGKKVPLKWLKTAIQGGDNGKLVHEFGQMFPSKVIAEDPVLNDAMTVYLNLTKVNLDTDFEDEYVLFIGSYYAQTMFYVIDHDFKIIHEEYLWLHNDYPQMKILSATDQHKLISFKFLYGRGSGFWLFTNKVYRLESGKLDLVLELVDDSNDTFNDKGINGMITADSFEEYGNELFVTCSFRLNPHYLVLEKLGIQDETFELIKREKVSAIYTYDTDLRKFIPKGGPITADMEAYFLKPGNDALFLKAFASDLALLLSNGTENQKKVVRYLQNLKPD